MPQLFRNNAKSTLAAALAAAGTSITVQATHGARFPALAGADFFMATLQDATTVEIVKVTARSADVFTIVRSQEGTSAPATFASGTIVSLRMTAAAVETMLNHPGVATAAHAATSISNTPAGNIAAVTVQAAINELDSEKADAAATAAALAFKAPITSPTFDGIPAAPTAAPGTNTTQVATTAFVTSAPAFPAGTRMMFQQTAAPTGWTKDVTAALNDSALRIVTGAVVNGGTAAFAATFASRTPAGSVAVGATTLTTAQIPAHTHAMNADGRTVPKRTGSDDLVDGTSGTASADDAGYGGDQNTGNTGGGGSHTHTGAFTGTAMDFAVKYYDVIIASKN